MTLVAPVDLNLKYDVKNVSYFDVSSAYKNGQFPKNN